MANRRGLDDAARPAGLCRSARIDGCRRGIRRGYFLRICEIDDSASSRDASLRFGGSVDGRGVALVVPLGVRSVAAVVGAVLVLAAGASVIETLIVPVR